MRASINQPLDIRLEELLDRSPRRNVYVMFQEERQPDYAPLLRAEDLIRLQEELG